MTETFVPQLDKMSTEQRFRTAVREVRNGGTYVALNVDTCCRGCATHKDFGIPEGETDFVWTYCGQGGRLTFMDGEPSVGEAFFYFAEIGAARTLRTVMRDHGFTVDWDGTKNKAVLVHFK